LQPTEIVQALKIYKWYIAIHLAFYVIRLYKSVDCLTISYEEQNRIKIQTPVNYNVINIKIPKNILRKTDSYFFHVWG